MTTEHGELGRSFSPPSLPSNALAQIARELFEVDGTLTPLRGEREQNAAVRTTTGDTFVLKLAPVHDRDAIDFQCAALDHIAQRDDTLPVPRIVATGDGELYTTVTTDDAEPVLARLLTFLPGCTFDDAVEVSASCLDGVGHLQASVATALADFDHHAADAHMPWALDSGSLADNRLWDGLDPDARDLAEPCRQRVDEVIDRLHDLPRQVIHSDGHRGNLLRPDARSESIVGVIDFGDLVRSATVCDLGISGASFLGDQRDPIGGLIALTRGYHRVRRLSSAEAALVPELVLSRMVLSTLMTDFQRHHSPHIATDVNAERPAILASLTTWSALDRDEIVERLIASLDFDQDSGLTDPR